MEPTLKPGDRILILNRGYQRLLKRGQIVILYQPNLSFDITSTSDIIFFAPKSLLVKRLIALEGDKNIAQSNFPDPIPNNHIFVLSDNPNGNDSRRWGPIPLSSIRGIALARIGKG